MPATVTNGFGVNRIRGLKRSKSDDFATTAKAFAFGKFC